MANENLNAMNITRKYDAEEILQPYASCNLRREHMMKHEKTTLAETKRLDTWQTEWFTNIVRSTLHLCSILRLRLRL
jgi:hypothetical protein